DVSVTGRAQLRSLRRSVRIDLTQPALDVHPQLVSMTLDLAQRTVVEGRTHLQYGAKEQAFHAELLRMIEAFDGTVVRRARDLPTVDANSHATALVRT